MDRFATFPTRRSADLGVVPERTPEPGFVPIAIAMEALELVTVLLNASCTVTWIAGAMATPAGASVGWTVKASLAAAAGEMLKAMEVAPLRAPELAAKV